MSAAPDEPSGNHPEVRQAAVRLLAAREHSASELTRKLRAKGFEETAVCTVVAELGGENLQSEARFVEGYVRARQAKGFGPLQIRQGLLQRGVAESSIDEHLTANAEHWITLAEGALAKRFKGQAVADRADWTRRARFLAGRGYPSDIIYRVLDDR